MTHDGTSPAAGMLLIAHPMLGDPNFFRSVVLLCQHDADGTFGLVLTEELPHAVDEVMPSLMGFDAPIGKGGPMQVDTLHYIHRHGHLITGAIPLLPDEVFWGGDLDLIEALVMGQETNSRQLRFFAGYAGWGEDQLADEVEEGSWFLTPATPDLIFETPPDQLWRTVLRRMGGQFAILANFPADPRLN